MAGLTTIGFIKAGKNARVRIAVSKWAGKWTISFRRQYKDSDYPVWLNSTGFNIPLAHLTALLAVLNAVEKYISNRANLRKILYPKPEQF